MSLNLEALWPLEPGCKEGKQGHMEAKTTGDNVLWVVQKLGIELHLQHAEA